MCGKKERASDSMEENVLTPCHGYFPFPCMGRSHLYWTELLLFFFVLYSIGSLCYHFKDPTHENFPGFIMCAVWIGNMFFAEFAIWGKATLGSQAILDNLSREIDALREINDLAESNNEEMDKQVDRFSGENDVFANTIDDLSKRKGEIEDKAFAIGETLEGIEIILEKQEQLLIQKEKSNERLDDLNMQEDINLWKEEVLALWTNTNQSPQAVDAQLKRVHAFFEFDKEVLGFAYKVYESNLKDASQFMFNKVLGHDSCQRFSIDPTIYKGMENHVMHKKELEVFLTIFEHVLLIALNQQESEHVAKASWKFLTDGYFLQVSKTVEATVETIKQNLYTQKIRDLLAQIESLDESRYGLSPEQAARFEQKDADEPERQDQLNFKFRPQKRKVFRFFQTRQQSAEDLGEIDITDKSEKEVEQESGKKARRKSDFLAWQEYYDRELSLFVDPRDAAAQKKERDGVKARVKPSSGDEEVNGDSFNLASERQAACPWDDNFGVCDFSKIPGDPHIYVADQVYCQNAGCKSDKLARVESLRVLLDKEVTVPARENSKSPEDLHIALIMLVEQVDINSEFQRGLFLSSKTFARISSEKENLEANLSELQAKFAALQGENLD